ncbi:UNVERIFIED_CONTAM: hypothetical protein Sradi_1598300 [Sesamum radiatum]|uniref:Uncharacterized protein n=1 Tax=Sesamum radiatum TaxID=300843 RepID=A0AAW2UEE3_SESRA
MHICDDDDDDVATMFEMHKVSKKINLYVADDLENVEGGNEEGSEEGATEEGLGVTMIMGLTRMVLKKRGLRVMMMRGMRVKNILTVMLAYLAEGCSWRVHASPLPDGKTFMIKTSESKHTCVKADKIKEASAWMANKLTDVLRENPYMKARGLRNEIRKFGVTPPYMQLYMEKKMVIDIIEGGHASS